MDQKNSASFPSKILLFGEYLILNGGDALSLPYHQFSLTKSIDTTIKHRDFFRNLYEYISTLDILGDRLSSDFLIQIEQGLRYESTIPIGYGLGSSGALVAAIYDEFISDKKTDFSDLIAELAAIESFFHDKSSGIDPLTSYLQKPIFQSQNEINVIEHVALNNFSLIDSGIKRNAREAIKHFQKIKTETKVANQLTELKEVSNQMISKWLTGEGIVAEMKQYSQIQCTCFSDFIPQNIMSQWKYGLESGEYYLKLCGAGMGGMYLKYEVK